MDWQHIIVGILSSAIVGVLGKFLKITLDEAQRKALDWALEKGVSAASERLRGAPGEVKQELAIRTAESLAPGPMKKLSDEQKAVAVDATYARMRPLLPHASDFSLSQDEVPHPLERYRSSPPDKDQA